jgi:hypothetical protein
MAASKTGVTQIINMVSVAPWRLFGGRKAFTIIVSLPESVGRQPAYFLEDFGALGDLAVLGISPCCGGAAK